MKLAGFESLRFHHADAERTLKPASATIRPKRATSDARDLVHDHHGRSPAPGAHPLDLSDEGLLADLAKRGGAGAEKLALNVGKAKP